MSGHHSTSLPRQGDASSRAPSQREAAPNSRQLRVGVVTNRNLESPWASTHYFACAAMRQAGASVIQVAGKFLRRHYANTLDRRLRRALGRRPRTLDLAELQAAVAEDFQRNDYDVVLALHASALAGVMELARCPIIYTTDATADLLQDYYPQRSSQTAEEALEYREAERRIIALAQYVLAPSEWAAESVIHGYHAPVEKVHVIEWGANLESIPQPKPRTSIGGDRPVELIFIGLDWQRKGGDIAIETTDVLQQRGVNARLTVVGAEAPRPLQREYITSAGQLNRATPAEAQRLNSLLRDADLLIHPARAECYGHALCEALAFGAPVVATNTGGISQCVTHGETGYLLPPGADAAEFADVIETLIQNPLEYARLRQNGIRDFQDRLNWTRWADRTMRLARQGPAEECRVGAIEASGG